MNQKRVASPCELEGLPETLRDTEVLLIVPPFHHLKSPALGVHLLQACAREAGFRVQVLYANLLLAAAIGEEAYGKIFDAPLETFAGERFFARCAYGVPPLGRRARQMFEADWVIGPHRDWEVTPDFECYDCKKPIKLAELQRWERSAEGYVDGIARAVAERRYRVVGCSTTFVQTSASIALLNRIKTLNKDTLTILGGANCEGEMARGIASLPSRVDYIFSGEGEVIFPAFVQSIRAGTLPPTRIIYGEPCWSMDVLPTPSYGEFYEQRQRFLPKSALPAEACEIPYETSRGCWWGEKHHCTFCGLSDETIAFRQKSPERVLEELHVLLGGHPSRKILMTDNIMPYTYFKTLLPRLAGEFPGASVFYDQKANLPLRKVLALTRAGIKLIEPGIEALSSRLLALIAKGVQARQNLVLLRDARAAGLNLDWNLLWGFPGDDVEAYRETLAILPLLRHLQPPLGMTHLSIDRFSPYFSEPAKFRVRNIKPLRGLRDLLPKGADTNRIACHFTATYPSGAHDHVEVINALWQQVKRWQAAWPQKNGVPNQNLKLRRKGESFVLDDTRDLWKKQRTYSLNEKEASDLVTARACSGSKLETWALREKLAVIADGWFVPLVVAEPQILLELIREDVIILKHSGQED